MILNGHQSTAVVTGQITLRLLERNLVVLAIIGENIILLCKNFCVVLTD